MRLLLDSREAKKRPALWAVAARGKGRSILPGTTKSKLHSTYCFRHTYATLRLQEGVDVYFLAEQMGTSVRMIESHYGHVNTVRHVDRVLQGMAGWELPQLDDAKAKRRKRQRPTIDPREVNATNRVWVIFP